MRMSCFSGMSNGWKLLVAKMALVSVLFAWIPSGDAVTITTAEIHPSGVISELDEVELSVQIRTAGSSAFLTRDTVLDVRRNEFVVRIYAESGVLGVPDFLTERVNIGRLAPGDYRLLVLLEPPAPSLGFRTFEVLEFTVVPVLRVLRNPNQGEEGLLLMWTDTDPEKQFFAEWTSDPARGEWNTVPGTPEDIGGILMMRIPDLVERQFFRLRKKP
jgi:hypothetical protein